MFTCHLRKYNLFNCFADIEVSLYVIICGKQKHDNGQIITHQLKLIWNF